MLKFVSLFKKKSFLITLMTALFLTSALIIIAMLMGNETGNFVIQVEDGDADKSISITDNENDKVFTNKLVTEGFSGMACSTPRIFLGSKSSEQTATIQALTSTLGRKVTQETLYVYTFEIVNTGNGALNMELKMSYSANDNSHVSEAIRVMTYCPSDSIQQLHVYQQADKPDKDGNPITYQYYPQTPEIFESSNTVFTQEAYMGASEADADDFERIRYSVFFWIEGYDPEAVEEMIASGTIKFALNIKVVN